MVGAVSLAIADLLWLQAGGRVVGAGVFWGLADGHLAVLLVGKILAVVVPIADPVLADALPFRAGRKNEKTCQGCMLPCCEFSD